MNWICLILNSPNSLAQKVSENEKISKNITKFWFCFWFFGVISQKFGDPENLEIFFSISFVYSISFSMFIHFETLSLFYQFIGCPLYDWWMIEYSSVSYKKIEGTRLINSRASTGNNYVQFRCFLMVNIEYRRFFSKYSNRN